MIRAARAAGRIARCSWFLATWTLRMARCRPAAQDREYEAWRREYFRGATQGLLRRIGVSVSVEGNFPAGPGILVSNHLGYLDVLVLGSLGPTIFVSRADVADWPVLGRLTQWCATIFIERDRREQIPAVVDQMRDALDTGSRVVFFPEGTSGSGERVMPFRGPLFEVATRTGAPVAIAALSYHTRPGDPPARDSVCWWGDAGFVRHFWGLTGLREVTAVVRFGNDPIAAGDRKELSRRSHAAVEALFEPVTGSPGDVR